MQARGPKKHLKRVAAPKHWMLDKLTGVFVSSSFIAPRFRPGVLRCFRETGSPQEELHLHLYVHATTCGVVVCWKMDQNAKRVVSFCNHDLPLWCFQAPRPSTGPHKLRECLPLIIFLRNRLKYALTGDEVKKICMQRFIKIDGKVRTDVTYPTGFMGELGPWRPGSASPNVFDVV